MSTASDIVTATQGNDKTVFETFRQHANGTRIETKSNVLNIIRDAYPDHHVTEVTQSGCSLFDYAAAGKATLTSDTEAGHFDTTRTWKSVGSGVQKKEHPGALYDENQFARLHYVWDDKEFLVYHVVFQDPFQSQTRLFYILHPRQADSSNIADGHCAETDALVLACGKWTSQLHKEIWVFDNGSWEKSKELWKAVEGSSWDDVILDPEMKKNLVEDVQGFFDNRKLYGQYAVPWKRGIILHGVPGNGKTVSIKALINSLYARPDQMSSLYVKSFQTKCNTEQYSIRQIFTRARHCAPCLLIFEDLDSLVDDSIRSYFLNEVDGLESNDGILMIGSTNHLDKLDPAIAKRPSRFDRKYHYKLPGDKERSLYAEYWRQKLLNKNDSVEFPEELCDIVAQLTEGFSFAYLKELFVMALLSLVRGFKGDGFEIVDADEAASAPETPDETPSSAPAAKSEEVCTCATKCSDCGKAVASATTLVTTEATSASISISASKPSKLSKATMPRVDVPEHLADLLLLKVIKHQIRVLHAEMDNTSTEEWPSGRNEVRNSGLGIG